MNTDITTTFKNYVNNGGTLHYRATLVLNDTNKTTLELDDDDFLQDTWEFQYDSCEGDFDIGGAIPSQFKCTLNNLTNKFTNYINYLDGGFITVYLRSVEERELYNSSTGAIMHYFVKNEEFCWGEFVVKVNFQHYETIDLQCYDRLYLLQQVNIIDYLNSIDSDRKLSSSLYYASTPYLISCMEDWFSDFGITSFNINNFCYTFQGTFLFPKEFYMTGFTPQTFYPREQVGSNSVLKIHTSDYDCQWLPADNELWKDKTLLDFLRYFCQMFGCYAQIRPDNKNVNTLYIDRYSKYIDYTVNYESINSLTYSYKTYTKELQQVVVKTCDTKVPMCGLPNVLYEGKPSSTSTVLKLQKYFTDRILVAPVSTGGYEIGYKEAYITIEDNPFILLPIGDKPFGDTSFNNWAIMNGSNSYGSYYVTARDVFGWSTDTRTVSNLRFASATQIAYNLHNSKGTKFGSLEGLRVCEFQCSCKPLVGMKVGQRLTIRRDNDGHYIDSLLNHIVFKPNVSMTLSTTFDGESQKTSHPNAIPVFTTGNDNKVFETFFADIKKSTKDCYTSILKDMKPDELFPCIKVLYDSNKGGEYATSLTTRDMNRFYYLMLYYLGEQSNSYTWSYSTRIGSLIKNPSYTGTAMDVKPVWTSK